MLADREDGIHGQVLSTAAERLGDRLINRNPVSPRHVAGHVLIGKLIGIERDDIHAGIDLLAAKDVWLEKVFENVEGVRSEPEFGENRGDFRTVRSLRRSRFGGGQAGDVKPHARGADKACGLDQEVSPGTRRPYLLVWYFTDGLR